MMSLSDERLIHDPAEWNALVAQYRLDCYYEHAYFGLEEDDGIPEMFFYPTEFGTLIYPYVKRNIDGTPYQDITTPYGYGGPVFVGLWSLDQIREVRQHFLEYCQTEQIITETIRFHPLLQNVELGQYWCRSTKELQRTVTIELTDTFETIEGGFSKMTRRNIRKARKEGVTVRVAGEADYETFERLYRLTMDKHDAAPRYYFSHTYFEQFTRGELDAELLVAERGGNIIGGCLVLYGDRFAHYHLGASDPEQLQVRPNHLLFAEMIRRAKQKGMVAIHLGGGTTPDETDSLFVYKSSFNEGSRTFFSIGSSVLDEVAYEQVNRSFLKNNPSAAASNWFPTYRTPIRHLSQRGEETS
ncbi:GNAT family N-acetyltransferase [Exiguobacterium sp. s193]|uniref:lipid II:glycine glycyltransferase FemX n=1 Tax=Exiguobacterium sp. s193 TaxID=2751207 RepID=UPI001BE9775D|nr:GNAT family N-acetyltransferase [Exiguobacterium sp. s193]